MTTTHKPKSGGNPEQIRDMMEAGAEQTKGFLDKVGGATTQAANAMQDSCSRALRGVQEYNQKLLEFTQENTKSNTASTSDDDIFGTFTILD